MKKKRLTRVIRRVKKSRRKRKGKSGGYDVSYRATGHRLVSKSEQNARHN